MDTVDGRDIVKRYLQDAIAAEKSFETQLNGFAEEGDDIEVRRLFSVHANETRGQYERLTARLNELGGETSTFKSLLAHVFNMAPKTPSLGHEEQEKTTQNLMIAYAVENSEVAMYEALAVVATAAGDTATATLARTIQEQEHETAQKVWMHIARSAARAYQTMVTGVVTRT